MPLTDKGEEILAAMKKQYGAEKGERVFYASKNAGKITGVDSDEVAMKLDAAVGMADAMSRGDANQIFLLTFIKKGSGELSIKRISANSEAEAIRRGKSSFSNHQQWRLEKVSLHGGYPSKLDSAVAKADALARGDASSNPFAPLPNKPEKDWSAEEHQRAANFHHYEMMGYTEENYQKGRVSANYKPMWSLHKSAYEEHSRKARAKRNTK